MITWLKRSEVPMETAREVVGQIWPMLSYNDRVQFNTSRVQHSARGQWSLITFQNQKLQGTASGEESQ